MPVTAATFARRLDMLRRSPAAAAVATACRPARAWLVGGALRDAALGRPTADLDALVERDAAGAAARLARALGGRAVALGGERFAAHRVIAGALTVDLWDLTGGALAGDLARRDFTINAMALDLSRGELLDPFHGRADVTRRRLRATRAGVFAEDPLRVVRLARFAATLEGFVVEPATARGARAAAPRLGEIAGERIRQELTALWRDSGFAPAQRALAATGVWPRLWGRRSQGDARAALRRARALDAALARLPTAELAAGRLASGHALSAGTAASRLAASAAIERLADFRVLSSAERRQALLLLTLASEAPPRAPGDLAWYLHRAGQLWPWALALGRALAPPRTTARWRAALAAAPALLAARREAILEPRPLLRGEQVTALLGGAKGPAVGAALRRLREAQVRGEVLDEESAARLVSAARRRRSAG